MYTTGKFSSHLDNEIGFSFEDLEHMSIRHQRAIIKQRALARMKKQKLKFQFRNKAGSPPGINDKSPRAMRNTSLPPVSIE